MSVERSKDLRAWRAEGATRRAPYDRAQLPALIPLGFDGPKLTTPRIVAMLSRALRRERANRGRWTYDVARHAALAQACRIERARLAKEARKL